MATFDRRFGSTLGTVLEVQAVGVTNVSSVSITGVKLISPGTIPKRSATIDVTVDGDTYEFEVDFMDEVFNLVTVTGGMSDDPTPL